MTHTLSETCIICGDQFPAKKAAAIYCRISKDRDGRELGVNRQREDTMALAHRRGYHVADRHAYEENDTPASGKPKPRKQYNAMIAAARAGEVAAIIGYSNSRLTRRMREVEDLLELFERHGTKIITCVSGDDDLSTADGRMVARIKASVDAAEAEKIAERTRRHHLQAAREGRNLGGGRAFGWKRDRINLEPTEAKLIRKAARDITEGVGLHKIANQWAAKGFQTPRGNRWTYASVRQVMTNGRLAGWRMYKYKIATDGQGNPVVGNHKPILDQQLFDQVQAKLTRPDTRSRKPRKGAYTYLLSGIARCGVCGRAMYGARRKWKKIDGSIAEHHSYVCTRYGHHTTISGHPTDAVVKAAVIARPRERDVVTIEPERFDQQDRLDTLTKQVKELLAEFRAGRVQNTVMAWSMIEDLAAERDELEAQRARFKARQDDIEAEFDAQVFTTGDIDRQRAALAESISAVVIQDNEDGRPRFDQERVQIAWR